MSTTTGLSEAYKAENRGPGLQAFVIVLIVVTLLSISLRFWSRAMLAVQPGRNHRRFWLDDWAALAAVPFILTEQCIAIVGVHAGFGRHAAVLTTSTLLRIARLSWSVYFIYDMGLFLTKVSALLFLRRIFPHNASGTWFNVGLAVAHALNAAWLVGIIFGTIFLCDPIEKSWNTSLPGHCGSTSSLYIGSAVPSVAIDLLILVLPLPKLWSLKTDKGRKIGLTVVFILGYSVIVMSLGRLITTLTNEEALNTDYSYAGVGFVYWVEAEPAFSLLGICLPTMLPLGRHLMTTYLSPIASKVSLALTSRESRSGSIESKNGTFSGAIIDRKEDSQVTVDGTQASWTYEVPGAHSLDSQREILRSTPRHY